jgi:hypothetical protein
VIAGLVLSSRQDGHLRDGPFAHAVKAALSAWPNRRANGVGQTAPDNSN